MKGGEILETTVYLLRKTLKLSQEKFGEKLGVGKTAISKIENGENNLTDTMAKLICREYNADYHWLMTGEGEMFSKADTNYIALIDRIMAGDNEFAKNTFKAFSKFSLEEWNALEKIVDKLLKEQNN